MPAGSTLARDEVDRRVLASSIDFDVELDPITLVEPGHAGTLDGADVHKRVRLAIITGDEAEALHGVEELDRTGRLVARQLALGSRFALFALLDRDDVANNLKVGRRDLAAAIDELELQLLTFSETFETGAAILVMSGSRARSAAATAQTEKGADDSAVRALYLFSRQWLTREARPWPARSPR